MARHGVILKMLGLIRLLRRTSLITRQIRQVMIDRCAYRRLLASLLILLILQLAVCIIVIGNRNQGYSTTLPQARQSSNADQYSTHTRDEVLQRMQRSAAVPSFDFSPLAFLRRIFSFPAPTLSPCPLVPPNLVGRRRQTYLLASDDQLERLHGRTVSRGGVSRPPNCTARHRVALVVPYRDRDENLRIFIHHIHPFLQRQQIDYRIYVVEQASGSSRFNRGMLMNIGFTEARKFYDYDCFIFHDVDLLPENDFNLYWCPNQPRHMSAAVDTFFYRNEGKKTAVSAYTPRFTTKMRLLLLTPTPRILSPHQSDRSAALYTLQLLFKTTSLLSLTRLPYNNLFGGVEAFKTSHFELINGFSNKFFGWGGEDDDLFNRVVFHNLNLTRYPLDIARYHMLPHEKQQPSSSRNKLADSGPERFEHDGLNSLVYQLEAIEERRLFTLIRVRIEPIEPPTTTGEW